MRPSETFSGFKTVLPLHVNHHNPPFCLRLQILAFPLCGTQADVFFMALRARLDCLTKPSDISHLTKL